MLPESRSMTIRHVISAGLMCCPVRPVSGSCRAASDSWTGGPDRAPPVSGPVPVRPYSGRGQYIVFLPFLKLIFSDGIPVPMPILRHYICVRSFCATLVFAFPGSALHYIQ